MELVFIDNFEHEFGTLVRPLNIGPKLNVNKAFRECPKR